METLGANLSLEAERSHSQCWVMTLTDTCLLQQVGNRSCLCGYSYLWLHGTVSCIAIWHLCPHALNDKGTLPSL